MSYIQQTYFQSVIYPVWFDARPLFYDPTLSRFPPNTPIKLIIKNMMIERWNPVTLYNKFYQSCAPSYCSYSQTVRTKSIVGVIITLVSMTGGLIVSLRLITPQFVKFIIHLLSMINRRQQQQQQQQGNLSSVVY
jgi:hypothetical protein